MTTLHADACVIGSGAVTSLPAGIDCGQDCSQTYPRGSVVSLMPVAAAGHEAIVPHRQENPAVQGANVPFVQVAR